MRKLYFIAVTATLLAAGCQKTEIINPVGDYPGMSFTTDFGKLTKAADADSTGLFNLKEQDFRVWAYAAHDFDNTPKDDVTKVTIYDNMADIKVEDNTNGWDPGKQYFWPGAGKQLYFFAVSDTDAFLGDVGVSDSESKESPVDITMNNTEENGVSVTTPTLMKITGYSVSATNPNNDLMVADFIKQSQEDNEKTVNLNFKHTLSKVQFLFVTNPVEDISVFVQKLEVVDLLTQGDLTVTPGNFVEGTEGEEVAAVTFSWDLVGDAEEENAIKADFVDDYETAYDGEDFPAKIEGNEPSADDKKAMKITATGTQDSPAQEFATWLVLPQDISDKTVKITYLINERQFTNEFALSKGLTKWEVNQYVKYTINLSPNLISFDASVDEWAQYDSDTDKGGNQDIEMQN